MLVRPAFSRRNVENVREASTVANRCRRRRSATGCAPVLEALDARGLSKQKIIEL